MEWAEYLGKYATYAEESIFDPIKNYHQRSMNNPINNPISIIPYLSPMGLFLGFVFRDLLRRHKAPCHRQQYVESPEIP